MRKSEVWIYSFVSCNGQLFLSSSTLVTTHWNNTRYFWHSHKKVWAVKTADVWVFSDRSSTHPVLKKLPMSASFSTTPKILCSKKSQAGPTWEHYERSANWVSRKLHATQFLHFSDRGM